MNLKLFKIIIEFLRYYVIVGSTIMTLHCACLLGGIDFWITDLLVGLSLGGYICLLITSYVLKMCNLYRGFLTHQFIVSSCITYQENIGFGNMLYPARIFTFVMGITLLILLLKNGFKENSCTIS